MNAVASLMIDLLTMISRLTGTHFLPAKSSRSADGSLEEGAARGQSDLACKAEADCWTLYRRGRRGLLLTARHMRK